MRLCNLLLPLVITVLLVASPLQASPTRGKHSPNKKPKTAAVAQPAAKVAAAQPPAATRDVTPPASSTDVTVPSPPQESLLERAEHFFLSGLGWFGPKVIGSLASTAVQFGVDAEMQTLGFDPTTAYYASMGLSLGAYKIINHAGEIVYQMLIGKPHPDVPLDKITPQESPIDKAELPKKDPGKDVFPGERILVPTTPPSDKDVKKVDPTPGLNTVAASCEKKFVDSIGYVWPALCQVAGLVAQTGVSKIVRAILSQGVEAAKSSFGTSLVADAMATLAGAGAAELMEEVGNKVEASRAKGAASAPKKA